MAALMTHGDAIFSLFIGHPSGDYFELSNLEASEGLRAGWQAEDHHRWVALKVFDMEGERSELREFLTDDLQIQHIKKAPSTYLAHQRPWFAAAKPDTVHRTEPYVLSISDQRGFSHVMQNPSGHVVGAIMLLSSLNQRLANRTFPESYFSVMFDENEHLLAQSTSNPEAGSMTELRPRDQAKFRALAAMRDNPEKMGKLQETTIDGETYYVFLEEIGADDNLAQPAYIGLAVSEAEVLAPSVKSALNGIGLSLLIMLLVAPIALFAARSITKPIRQLTHDTQLIRARRFAEVEPVDSHIREVTWLSDSLVDMSSAICDYQEQQRALHEGIIKLVAGSIDQKSPYTGGHCERVPEIGLSLAEAASLSDAPAFKDFNILLDEQWREFRVAAWLHDAGKITTPEHIVDKGSKLEALFNRIHEVRMRFEVLLRDAEIDYWKSLSQQPEREQALQQELQTRRQQIIDDFAFVAECNVGGEFMDDARLERLQQIASQTWVRNLDNRLGLSPAEELHVADHPSSTPAVEPLLADRPEHLFKDEFSKDRYEGMGFTLEPGEYKQNLGELYNLSIRRGTATDEDRYIINEHITATIKMLESLPWPEDLRRVPEIAGGHHEKLDGTGYPRSLTAEQLSVPAKILAVADVFEALTAADRPYKKAKPLSIALKIMRSMSEEGHLDPALFKLLITSGTYQRYAEQFLPPGQVDAVDEAALLEGL